MGSRMEEDIKTKTSYLVTWVLRDKSGNIKEMGNDYPKFEKKEEK